jgi:DNA modification methylase
MGKRIRKNQYIKFGADSSCPVAIEYRRIADLTPLARNARTHTKKQIRQIAHSIETFGWTNPILIDGEGNIIAGNGRVEAGRLLGMERVPTLRIDHLSEEQKRAYILADNRLAELAGWDMEVLATELQFLTSIDLDFDIEIIGFETAEVDLAIDGLSADDDDLADEIPEADPTAPSISQAGDLWRLGSHRLLCGDARDPAAYDAVLGSNKARMAFTDPPYNVRIDGHVCGLGAIKHREFAMASGEMSEAEFTGFLETALANMAAVSVDGALHYVFMDWRHAYELQTAARNVSLVLKNLCVWNKTNAGMGSFYRSKHELVFVLKVGAAPHVNNVELGRFGRARNNVWDYPGASSLQAGRLEDLRMHPTPKPVGLVADAIRDASHRGDLILDPFGGSGTTIIAAEKTGRRAAAIEIDPGYVDTAIRRWQTYTRQDAVHPETGLTFAEISEARSREAEPSGSQKEVVDDR